MDISKAGLYKYVQSFDFAILLFAYSIDGGPVQIVDLAQGEEIPPDITSALGDINVTKYAYNAAFEQYCLSKYYTTPIISGAVPWCKVCTVVILRGCLR